MISLDTIVKGVLLKKGYPIHWYLSFLVFARNCLRELMFDDLHVIESVLVTVNSYGAIPFPQGFADLVKIGMPVGQYIRPLVQDDRITNLPNINSKGEIVPYYQQNNNPDPRQNALLGIENLNTWETYGGWNYEFPTYDNFGENLGRLYGFRSIGNDTYKVIWERCIIQLNESFISKQISLDFIGDGSCCDSATKIHPYAIATIEAYIEWQCKDTNRNYANAEAEKQWYLHERKILRGRKSDVTIPGIKRSIQNGYNK